MVSITLTGLINNVANELDSNTNLPRNDLLYCAIKYFNETESIPANYFSFNTGNGHWKFVTTSYLGSGNYKHDDAKEIYILQNFIIVGFLNCIKTLLANTNTVISTTTDLGTLITLKQLVINYKIMINYISNSNNLELIIKYYGNVKFF